MKNKIFLVVMLVISALLFLLRMTGMTVHIVLSLIGVAALVADVVFSRKDWKSPALAIILRVLYAVALFSGVVLKVIYLPLVSIAHKVSAAAFAVLLLVMYIPAFFKKEQKA